jgi:hypothetical protein
MKNIGNGEFIYLDNNIYEDYFNSIVKNQYNIKERIIDDIKSFETQKKVINFVVNDIDKILSTKRKRIIEKERVYKLFRFCLPYVIEGSNILNREYQHLFYPKYNFIRGRDYCFWKIKDMKKEDSSIYGYLYDDESNPTNLGDKVINKQYWEVYKKKLSELFEKIEYQLKNN